MHSAFTLSESLKVVTYITFNLENDLFKKRASMQKRYKTCTSIILDIFVCVYVVMSVKSHV